MKLILREDVKDLGRAGQTVTVSEGYGRNFLLPKNLALPATPANLKRLEQELNGAKGRERRARKDAEYLAQKLTAQPLVITAQAGEGGKLFGSVTTADLEQALAGRGLEIDKRKLELEEPIKMLGTYTVAVKLPLDVTASLTVVVQPKQPAPVKNETPAAPAPETEASTPPAQS